MLLTEKVKRLPYPFIFGAAVFAVSLAALILILPNMYNLVKVSFSICLGVLSGAFFWYMRDGAVKSTGFKDFLRNNKYYLMLIGIIIIVYLPVLINGFYYNDDYWVYGGFYDNNTEVCITLGRAYHGLIADCFFYVTPATSFFVRWFIVLFTMVFGLSLYKWMSEKSEQPGLAFFIAAAICVCSFIADCTGYIATISFIPGVAAAGMSVILFDRAYRLLNEKKAKSALLWLMLSAICLFMSFMLYQIATAAVFIFLVVCVYFNKQKKSCLLFCLAYAVLFALIAVLDLVASGFIAAHYNLPMNARGSFIGSIPEAVSKARWFFDYILPAVFGRLQVGLLGRWMTHDKSYQGAVGYVSPQTANIVMYVLAAFIILALVMLLVRKRKVIDVLIVVAIVPMSYYCFLVLRESSYFTYYAMPLLSVLLFLILIGITDIIKLITAGISKICRKEFRSPFRLFLACIVVLFGFQTHLYLWQYWVGVNLEPYNKIRSAISAEKSDLTQIHVYGTPTPGQANIYSEFAVNVALREMGLDPNDYKVTTSDNEYYMSNIEAAEYEGIKEKLSLEQKAFLDGYYVLETTYMQYHLKSDAFSSDPDKNAEQLSALREVFAAADAIPVDSGDGVVIDLRGTSSQWPS